VQTDHGLRGAVGPGLLRRPGLGRLQEESGAGRRRPARSLRSISLSNSVTAGPSAGAAAAIEFSARAESASRLGRLRLLIMNERSELETGLCGIFVESRQVWRPVRLLTL
jgi:hypothetical protein